MSNRRRYGGRRGSFLLALAVTAVLTAAAAFFPELWETPQSAPAVTENTGMVYGLEDLPAYDGKPYVKINGGKPFFAETDYTPDSIERYRPIDGLGR